jgi:hypothetical protein
MIKNTWKSQNFVLGSLALSLLVHAHIVSAHHASGPHYFMDQSVTIEDAVISELKMVNPHSYIYFEALGDDDEMSGWRCSLRPATALLKQGWTDESFVEGQVVTIEGHPARREDNVCLITAITLSDGTEIGPNDSWPGADAVPGRSQVVVSDTRDRSEPLANGQPDISGDWVSLSFVRGGLGGQSRLPNNGFDPTEANLIAAEPYDVRFDDPATKCHVINIIQGWNHDANVNRITQFDDRVVLTYGWMDFVRNIYLDAEHPDNIVPSAGGHSIGTWEEGVLVVDTIGFLAGVLSHRAGILHSDQMHISERIYYEEASGELVRDYVVEDPLYLNTPYVAQDRQRVSAVPYTPYNCMELSGQNNIRPEDFDF